MSVEKRDNRLVTWLEIQSCLVEWSNLSVNVNVYGEILNVECSNGGFTTAAVYKWLAKSLDSSGDLYLQLVCFLREV